MNDENPTDELGQAEVLALLSDDSYGLWEIRWHLAGSTPETEQSQRDLVSTMSSLVRAGKIVVYSTKRTPGACLTPLAAEEALTVARDLTSYEAPEMGAQTFEADLAPAADR